jgi:tetratricopeptide (TPR) repeat protein
LEEANWTPAKADELERMLPELPDPAAAKQKLHEAVAERVRAVVRRPRLGPADRDAVEPELQWLFHREPSTVLELRAALAKRLTEWQIVLDLGVPFEGASDVIPAAFYERTEAGRLRSRQPRLLGTRIPSAGPVRVTVQYAAGWEKFGQLGIALDSPAQGVGDRSAAYSFQIVPETDPLVRNATFERTNRAARAEILFADAVLFRTAVRLPASGPLQIIATRERDGLSLQVGNEPSRLFRDVTPASTTDGTVAILAAPRCELEQLRIESIPVPPAPSRLELADDHYARGRFVDALAEYRRAGSDAEVACKIGLCLAKLDRHAEALATLETVVPSSETRWAAVALCQLWLLHLRAERFQDAEALFVSAMGRFKRDQLVANVPDELRRAILQRVTIPPTNYLTPDLTVIEKMETFAKIAALLDEPQVALMHQYQVSIARMLAGDTSGATDLSSRLIREVFDPAAAARFVGGLPWLARMYAWAGMQNGQIDTVVATLYQMADRHFPYGSLAKEFPPYAVRTARGTYLFLAIAEYRRGRKVEALNNLNRFDQPVEGEHRFEFNAMAALCRGFLRLDAGDRAGAMKVWKEGTYREFRRLHPGHDFSDPLAGPATPSSWYNLYYAILLGSLSDSLSDSDAEAMLKQLANAASSDPTIVQVFSTLQIRGEHVRSMWQSSKGQEYARKVAFLDISAKEYFRVPVQLIGYEKLRRDVFAGKSTPAQDEICWQACTGLTTDVFDKNISRTNAVQIALGWKGTFGFLGWGGAQASIPKTTRGPLAYLMGFRYVTLKKPGEAKQLFQQAVQDAEPGSDLAKLAAAEAAKLK